MWGGTDQQHNLSFLTLFLTTIWPAGGLTTCTSQPGAYSSTSLYRITYVHFIKSHILSNNSPLCSLFHYTSRLIKYPERTAKSTCSAHELHLKAANVMVTHALVTSTPSQTDITGGTRSGVTLAMPKLSCELGKWWPHIWIFRGQIINLHQCSNQLQFDMILLLVYFFVNWGKDNHIWLPRNEKFSNRFQLNFITCQLWKSLGTHNGQISFPKMNLDWKPILNTNSKKV